MTFELKLADRRVVVWEGEDGIDAARRYVDCHRDATVIAFRKVNHHGLFVIERPDRMRILEPGDRGWGQ